METQTSFRLLIALATAAAFGIFADPRLQAEDEPPLSDDDGASQFEKESGYEQIKLFTRVLEIVRQNYADSDKVNYDSLIGDALEGMLAGLDPHSQFMQRPIFEQLKRSTDNTYDGVGITIAIKSDTLAIVAVREDGPAARAGVLPGDQILRIGDIATDKVGLTEAIFLLKGKPGKALTLTLRRPATKELIEIEMIREVIQRDTVKDAQLLPKSIAGRHKIGYIRLLQFSTRTADELGEQLNHLEDQGMEAFVLDMRNNPGGLLNSAIDVCSEFLPPKTLVLTTEGRPEVADVTTFYTDKRSDEVRSYPIAILVNYASASGAEVVAGALQDLNRAIVVGSTTFGKGSVQSVMPVGSGTAIRLTTAKYYTPSKRTIHENGVIPNIVVSLTPSEEKRLMQEWRDHAREDDVAGEDQNDAKPFQDRQLARAVDAIKGALVYSDLGSKSPKPKGGKASSKKK